MSGPLDGYRVIELTSTVSGPIAGMILGDQGADIIKVEPPMLGDLARHMGDSRNGMGAMFTTLNRNKRSLALDLKDAADLGLFLRLVPTADVLIENYRPGIVRRLGIDYDALARVNPQLIYASISGYGQSGPYRHRKVYDPLIQATTGTAHEQNRDRPTNVRTIIFDKVTGYTAAQAITAALLQRARTGLGQYLPISMLSSALYFQWPDVMWSHTFQGEGVRSSGALADWFPVFRTADGYASIIIADDQAFVCLCEVLGLELYQDGRFATLRARATNMQALLELLEEPLSRWTTAALCAELDPRDVPVARVNSLDEIHTDPQIVEQGVLREVEHPVAGPMRLADTPFRFEQQRELPARHAPQLGQHSREILEELGCDHEDIERIEQREQRNREALAELARSRR